MRFIQVVGTKGKGSTSAYIANILQASGYRTGLFISPHVRVENERISIDGVNIDDDNLKRLMEKTTETGYFRKFYQCSLPWFEENGVDFAVMETGMGGRKDPSTLLPAEEVVFTKIGMDHMDILGKTVELICLEKAAAIRDMGETVSAPQTEAVRHILQSTCYIRKSPFSYINENDFTVNADKSFSCFGIDGLRINNPATMQYVNAVTAVKCCLNLRKKGCHISDDSIRAGLINTELLARQQYIEKFNCIVDGAHNIDSLQFLHDTLKTEYNGRRKVLICSAMTDKDVSYFDVMAKDQFDMVYASTMDYDRAMTAEQMSEIFSEKEKIVLCTGFEDALNKAMEYQKTAGCIIVMAGSIYQAGEALDLLQERG